ncbi:MAG: hypothetical protein R3E32_27390 [Chitinophagales bacterium]
MQQNYPIYFDSDGHLTTIARAMYADAMKLDKVTQLPDSVQEHTNVCNYCSSLIVVLFDAIEGIDYQDLAPHPVFEQNEKSHYSISDNPQNIEAILQQLMAEAVEIPSMERLLKTQSNYRKSDIEDLQVIQPLPNALYFNSVDFQFEKPLSHITDLSIRNHKGRVFKASLPIDTKDYTLTFSPRENFPSGLYYWKLTSRNSKPLVGKLYIYHP